MEHRRNRYATVKMWDLEPTGTLFVELIRAVGYTRFGTISIFLEIF